MIAKQAASFAYWAVWILTFPSYLCHLAAADNAPDGWFAEQTLLALPAGDAISSYGCASPLSGEDCSPEAVALVADSNRLAGFHSEISAPLQLTAAWLDFDGTRPPLDVSGLEALSNSTGSAGAAVLPQRSLSRQLGVDLRRLWSSETVPNLLPAIAIGYALANDHEDEQLQAEWQDHVRSDGGDKYFKVAKIFGEGYLVVPAVLITYCMFEVAWDEGDTSPLRSWNEALLRAYIIGSPALLAAQQLTGGSRPGESAHGSQWKPLADDNGVSGHSFMGALPFLTAAQLTDDWRLKGVLWAASLATPFSRVNDNAHYMSQAIMGWGLAYATTRAVAGGGQSWCVMTPLVTADAAGMAFIIAF